MLLLRAISVCDGSEAAAAAAAASTGCVNTETEGKMMERKFIIQ
jgi:hypothetical protein